MSFQDGLPTFCEEDEETRRKLTRVDIVRTYAFISRFAKNGITATVIALYNPASHHHWISSTLATMLSNELDYKPTVKCSDCEEVGLAVGMIELEWSCNDLGPLRLKTKFLISRDGQFNILLGQEEEHHSIPFQIIRCRRAVHNGHLNHKEKVPVDMPGVDKEKDLEEDSLQEALNEGLFIEVEEPAANTELSGPSLEDISAELDCVTYSTYESNQPYAQSSRKPIQEVVTPQSLKCSHLKERSHICSNCFCEVVNNVGILDKSYALEESKKVAAAPFKDENEKLGNAVFDDCDAPHHPSFSRSKGVEEREESKNITFGSESDSTGSEDDSHSVRSETTRASTIILEEPSNQEPRISNQTQTSNFQQLFKRVDNLLTDSSSNILESIISGSPYLTHNVIFGTQVPFEVNRDEPIQVAPFMVDDHIPKLKDFLFPGKADFTNDQKAETKGLSSVSYATAMLKSDKPLSIKRWLKSDLRNERVAVALLKEKDIRKRTVKSSTWPLESRTKTAFKTASNVTWNERPSFFRSWNMLPTARSKEVDELLKLKKEDQHLRKIAEDYWAWNSDYQEYYHDDPDGTRVWYNLPPGEEPPVVRKS